jgi:hypothetical protein
LARARVAISGAHWQWFNGESLWFATLRLDSGQYGVPYWSMENVAKFPIRETERSETLTDAAAQELAAAIETMLSRASLAERETVIRLLAEKLKPNTSAKAGDVLGVILRILPKRTEWTVSDLKKGVADRGVTATPKQVFNAVGHLTRTGRITRVGYGRYFVGGAPVETADDLGGELSRVERMDPN